MVLFLITLILVIVLKLKIRKVDDFLKVRRAAQNDANMAAQYGNAKHISLARVKKKALKLLLHKTYLVLIVALLIDVILIILLVMLSGSGPNMIAPLLLLFLNDKETLENMGIDPDSWVWDFSSWFSGKHGGPGQNTGYLSGWVKDPKLLLRQKTMYIFRKASEGTIFDGKPYLLYGIGLRETGPRAYYEYEETVEDADPTLHLIQTGRKAHQEAADANWVLTSNRAVGPFQYIGPYSGNKMRYKVDMDFSGKFDVTDVSQGGKVTPVVSDGHSFARPGVLYLPDVTYSYAHWLNDCNNAETTRNWVEGFDSLSAENQQLMSIIFTGYRHGYGPGWTGDEGWEEKSMSSGSHVYAPAHFRQFARAMVDYLNSGGSIEKIVGDPEKYWDANDLRVTYTWDNLKQFWETELEMTNITRDKLQGYREPVGLYAACVGYIEWTMLDKMIESAEKTTVDGPTGGSSTLGPPLKGGPFFLSSQVGYRTLHSEIHKGNDISVNRKPGIPIYAIADGKVIAKISDMDKSKGGGNIIMYRIDLGGIPTTITCMHMASPTPLNVGDVVKLGDPIGIVGTTGSSTGIHLHIEFIPHVTDTSIVEYTYSTGQAPMKDAGYKGNIKEVPSGGSLKPIPILAAYMLAGYSESDARAILSGGGIQTSDVLMDSPINTGSIMLRIGNDNRSLKGWSY